MGWRVALTPEAEADLRQIVAFIAEQSPGSAERFGLGLIELMYSLDQSPFCGVAIRSRPSLRKLPYRYVVVIYRIDEAAGRVEIVRLWDGRRDPARLRLD